MDTFATDTRSWDHTQCDSSICGNWFVSTISACAGFVAAPANTIRRGRASCWDGKRFLPNS